MTLIRKGDRVRLKETLMLACGGVVHAGAEFEVVRIFNVIVGPGQIERRLALARHDEIILPQVRPELVEVIQ